jgi:sodium transport system ATP-binding protein
MIEVKGLRKRFAQGSGKSKRVVQAVDGVSWQAANGAITGMLGPNGAGKTTTLRMVAALITPDEGTAQVDGLEVAREPKAALSRMGVLSDARGLYTRLTARENIVYYGRLHGMHEDEAHARAEELATLLEMKPLLERRTEGFSTGEKMKTSLARALVHNPPNIILDEPTNGLDVLATRALREALRRLRDEQGKCIVFSTHIMQEVQRLCDRVVIVSHGRTVAEGTVAELCERAGEADFEEAFVRLAFSADERSRGETSLAAATGAQA